MTWRELLVDGMLVQAVTTLALVVTWCVMTALQIPVPPFMETLLTMVIGHWFGVVLTKASYRASCHCK